MKLPLITAAVIAALSTAHAAVTPPVVTATTVTQVYTKDIITPPVPPNTLVPAPAPYDTTTTRTTWSDTAVFLSFDASLGTLNSVTITQDAAIYGRIVFVGTGQYDLDLVLGVVADTSAFATRSLTSIVDDHQVGTGNHVETITFQDSDFYPDPGVPDPAINPAPFIGTGVETINIPVRASGSTTDSSDNTIQSAYAAFAGAKITLVYTYTPPVSGGCTYTQGYWKNHTANWPVSSLKLGSVTYSSAQLRAIFNKPPAGNGLITLAHQLIAAKLNMAHGASGAAVAAQIAAADALINGLVVPPVGGGYLAPGATSALVTALTNYNEGTTGPGHCD